MICNDPSCIIMIHCISHNETNFFMYFMARSHYTITFKLLLRLCLLDAKRIAKRPLDINKVQYWRIDLALIKKPPPTRSPYLHASARQIRHVQLLLSMYLSMYLGRQIPVCCTFVGDCLPFGSAYWDSQEATFRVAVEGFRARLAAVVTVSATGTDLEAKFGPITLKWIWWRWAPGQELSRHAVNGDYPYRLCG